MKNTIKKLVWRGIVVGAFDTSNGHYRAQNGDFVVGCTSHIYHKSPKGLNHDGKFIVRWACGAAAEIEYRFDGTDILDIEFGGIAPKSH